MPTANAISVATLRISVKGVAEKQQNLSERANHIELSILDARAGERDGKNKQSEKLGFLAARTVV